MHQNHILIGLASNVKKQICIVYRQSLSQILCTFVNTEYQEFLREQNFWNKYKHDLI